jgi:hypothetical protein
MDSTARGASIAAYIKTKNAPLETQLQTDIQNAISSIGNIPEPFRNNLSASVKIEAAMTAITTLHVTLDKVKTLLSQ